MTTNPHQHFMQRAIDLARNGLYTTDPNPRVGCVLVKDNQIIAEGWHERAGEGHAEVNALKQLDGEAKGATAYVTLEPCCHHGRTGPCCEALITAGISHVTVAMQDPNPLVAGKGIARLREARITVEVGVLEAQSRELNPGFIKRMETGLPYVRAKMAMSLDGRTALQNGVSQWITSEAARQDGYTLRARSSVILTGIETVLADDPQLNVRLLNISRQPWRVIVDSQLRTPPTARCLVLEGKTIIATINDDIKKISVLEKAGAEILMLPAKNNRIDLRALLIELAKRGANEVHVEAGAALTGALIAEELVDELVAYIAPILLGDSARALLQLPIFTELQQAIKLEFVNIEKIGSDIKITARIK